MMKIIPLLLLLYCCTMNQLAAQSEKNKDKEFVYAEEDQYEDDPYYWSNTKEIGINFTPLISKLVPFNLGQNDAGNIGLIYKKYYSKRAFRFSLGANISDNFDISGTNFFYLALGLERRFPITKDKKIAYTSSWDIFLQAKDGDDNPLFGVSKGYGFEYHFTKRVFISTEAQFKLGIGSDSGIPLLELKLPTAIFVNVRLY